MSGSEMRSFLQDQGIPPIDAEIVKKDHFQMNSNISPPLSKAGLPGYFFYSSSFVDYKL